MKTKQTPEVIATRNEIDRLALLAPDRPYSDCTPEEKKRYDDISTALENHRIAVRTARRAA